MAHVNHNVLSSHCESTYTFPDIRCLHSTTRTGQCLAYEDLETDIITRLLLEPSMQA